MLRKANFLFVEIRPEIAVIGRGLEGFPSHPAGCGFVVAEEVFK